MIFVKTLQMHLQPLLVKVIDNNQTTFLLLRFILDKFRLKHEAIQWAMEAHQDSIFLKLENNFYY